VTIAPQAYLPIGGVPAGGTEWPIRLATQFGYERTVRFLASGKEFEGGKTRFQTYWEHTAECLFAVRVRQDGDFVFEGINPAYERVSGLTNAMIAGKAPHECLPLEIANEAAGHYQDCISAREVIQYEEVLRLPSGVKRLHTTLAPMRNPGTGEITLILGSARDITPIFEAHTQAERGRLLLDGIAKACPDFIYVFGIDTRRIEFIGARVQEVLGHAPEHLHALGSRVLNKLVHPDDLMRVARYFERLSELPDNGVATLNCRLFDANGSVRWFKTRDTVFTRAPDGRAAKILGVAVDINDLKETQAALCESNRRLRSVLAGVSDCYFSVDRDLKITDVNEATVKWVGRPMAELVGQPALQVFRNSPLDDVENRRAIFDGRTDRVEMPSALHPGRWVEASFYPSSEGLSCFFRDITERKASRDAIERTKRLLESTINAMSAIVAILDEDGCIVMVNDAWRRFVRCTDGGTFGDVPGTDYLAPSNITPQRRDMARLRAGLGSVLAGSASTYRLTYRVRGAGKCWFRVTANRYQSDGWTGVVVAHEDVSDLHLALRSVGDLSQRLNNIQEEERQRIACELHDSTSQHLTAVSLNMISLRQQLMKGAMPEGLLNDIERSVEEAQKEIRIFSYLLHPTYLDRDGLKATLARFVSGFARRTAIAADVRIGADVDAVSFPLQRAVLRIVQEALTNVHRHASASRVVVSLSVRQDRLVLLVTDNGMGIKTSARRRGCDRPKGVGLSGMQTRVSQFGGELAIQSGRMGTRIRARIPLSSAC
jgi:PAS domain S-box-containing protein